MEPLEDVYIAGKWQDRGKLAVFANKIKGLGGYNIRCRWLDALDETNTAMSWREYAERDGEDIYGKGPGTGIFILFAETPPLPPRNSRLVELGYALAYAKTVFIVGKIETIFCTLADEIYATEEDCLVGLREFALQEDDDAEVEAPKI